MLPHTTSNNLSVKDIKPLPVSNLQVLLHLSVGVSNQPGDGTERQGEICLGAFSEMDRTGTQATYLLVQCFNLNSNLLVEGADCGETQYLKTRWSSPNL